MVATKAKPLRMGRTEWGLLLLSLLWGASFFFFKILVREYPPFTLVLGRVGLAAVAMLALLRMRGEALPLAPRLWGSAAVMALLNNVVPFSLISFGEQSVSSGLAAILNATTPLFAVVLAHLLPADERLTPARILGLALGLSGVAVLIGPELLASLGASAVAGQAACLLAAFSYALAGLYGRRFRTTAPTVLATVQLTASTVILISLSLMFDRPWDLSPPSSEALAAFLGISLFCTALAYILYFRILAVAGATNLLLVTFLLPVSALLLGRLFLSEPIVARSVVGMAIIGFGLVAIDGRLSAWLARRRTPTNPPAHPKYEI